MIVKCRDASTRIPSPPRRILLLLLLPAAAAAAHAEGKAAVRSWFMEHILQPTPSLLTSSSPLPPLTASSIRFTRFPPPPLRFASRPYSARAHVLVGCKPTPPLFMELPFSPSAPSTTGQTSPTNPSPPKSAQLAKISSLAKCYVPEICYISTKY